MLVSSSFSSVFSVLVSVLTSSLFTSPFSSLFSVFSLSSAAGVLLHTNVYAAVAADWKAAFVSCLLSFVSTVSLSSSALSSVSSSSEVSLLVLIMAAVTVDAAGSVSSGEEASL